MKALILAAGYATRLYPLTMNRPKPLLPLAGRPVMEYIIEQIFAVDEVDEILAVTNEKFFRHFQDWQKNFATKKAIKILSDKSRSEEERLGAIGDMDFVIREENLEQDLLVIAGDNLFTSGLREFVDFALDKAEGKALDKAEGKALDKAEGKALDKAEGKALDKAEGKALDKAEGKALDKAEGKALSKAEGKALGKAPASSIGLYNVEDKEAVRRYSQVRVNAEGKIIEFVEKPQTPNSTLVAKCVYFFPKSKLNLISEYIKSGGSIDAPGHYISWLCKRDAVYGFTFSGKWYDIGNYEIYKKADKDFTNRKENE